MTNFIELTPFDYIGKRIIEDTMGRLTYGNEVTLFNIISFFSNLILLPLIVFVVATIHILVFLINSIVNILTYPLVTITKEDAP